MKANTEQKIVEEFISLSKRALILASTWRMTKLEYLIAVMKGCCLALAQANRYVCTNGEREANDSWQNVVDGVNNGLNAAKDLNMHCMSEEEFEAYASASARAHTPGKDNIIN